MFILVYILLWGFDNEAYDEEVGECAVTLGY